MRPAVRTWKVLAVALVAAIATAAADAATLSESPASVIRGAAVTATWSGIATPTARDWITMAVPGSPNTSYVTYRYTGGAASGSVPFTTPWNVAPGTYELRLFANDTFTLLATSNTFTVTLPTLTVSAAGALQGGSITATWAVGAPSTGDWMGLYAVGAADTAYQVFRYTGGGATGSVPITIPAAAANGNYEIRLFMNNGYTRFATSSTFYVGPRTVSGTVTIGGAAQSGVAMAATNGVSCTATNASGQYSCTGINGWSGTVTPSYTGYVFTPASRSYTNVTADQTAQDYAGSVVYVVSGTVRLNGSGLSGVAVAATNGVTCSTTNASGQYSCTAPSGWSGSVTPSLAGYVFTPASRSYSSIAANQPTQDYTALPLRQVSGTVTSNGAPLPGVAFAATNGVSCSGSNASGQYACTVPQGWSGTVTPSLAGYNFGPGSRSYPNIVGDETAQDYAGTQAVASSRIYYVHVDYLNTPRAVSDSSGTAVWRWDQTEPFGDSVPDNNPLGLGIFENPLRFPGQYADAETGLLYNYFRYLDQGRGQYTTFDPMGLRAGINGYAYVAGRPLSFTDRKGLCPWCVGAGTASGLGGGEAATIGGAASSRGNQSNKRDASGFGDDLFPEANKKPGPIWPQWFSWPNWVSSESADETKQCPVPVPEDPKQAPGPEWEWRGKGEPGSDKGSWFNPGTGESMHPDLNHPDPVGPHWDYTDPSGKQWRVDPGSGTMTPK